MKKDKKFYRVVPGPHTVNFPLQIVTVYTLFESVGESERIFEGEFHDPWEMVYVVSGEVTVTADDTVYILSGGDMIFHMPLEFHTIRTNRDDTVYFVMSFDVEGEKSHLLEHAVFSLNDDERGIINSVMQGLTEIDTENYHNYISYWKDNPNELLRAVKGFEFLYMTLIKRQSLPTETFSANKLYSDIVDLLKNRITDNLTIPEIADACKVSEATVKSVFKKYAGCGIHKFYLKLKLRYAINLLREGNSVSSVSDALGFNNPNYFSFVFRRETGKSPSDYK